MVNYNKKFFRAATKATKTCYEKLLLKAVVTTCLIT